MLFRSSFIGGYEYHCSWHGAAQCGRRHRFATLHCSPLYRRTSDRLLSCRSLAASGRLPFGRELLKGSPAALGLSLIHISSLIAKKLDMLNADEFRTLYPDQDHGCLLYTSVPVVAAGVPCQNSGTCSHHSVGELGCGGQQGGIPMEEMPQYVQAVSYTHLVHQEIQICLGWMIILIINW